MTNKTLRLALGLGAAVFFLALYYWKFTTPIPSQKAESDDHSAGLVQHTAADPKIPTKPQPSLMAQTIDELSIRKVTAIETEVDFRNALEEADLMRTSDMTQLVERLKLSNAKTVAEYLLNSLHEVGDQNPDQRDRIMLLAEFWRSDELLPLWQDLALRTSPRYGNEAAYINPPEPNELSRGIQLEMMTAVSNLGMMGSRSPEALQTLKEIVGTSTSKVHTLFIRERAYAALKEADLTASVLAVKRLANDDPLRQQIQRK